MAISACTERLSHSSTVVRKLKIMVEMPTTMASATTSDAMAIEVRRSDWAKWRKAIFARMERGLIQLEKRTLRVGTKNAKPRRVKSAAPKLSHAGPDVRARWA